MRQGIVMEIQAGHAYVFTNDCDLVKVAARRNLFIGQSIALPETSTLALPRRRLFYAFLAACLVLVIGAALLLSGILLPQAGPVYLSLDINPSVEFVLDANRNVTDVIPMNSDAWVLLGENDFTGLGYDAAIARWVSLAREKMPAKLEQLLISAVLTRRDRVFADQLMALDTEQGNGWISELAGLKVKVLYSMDLAVKLEADANNLSFGRQMLLARAQELRLGMDADEIRTTSLQTLFSCLLPPVATEPAEETTKETSALTVLTTTEAAPTPQPSAETTGTTSEETTQATTKATTQATTKATTKATTEPGGERLLQVLANGGDGWKLQWSYAQEAMDFSYYKVVISKNDSTPRYPDNGYLYAISNRIEHQCWVNNERAYNGGDFDGYLVPGQQYYVAVTYVYAGGKYTSNVLKLTYNGPAAPAPTTTAATEAPVLHLEGNSDVEGVHLYWDISPEKYTLKYYKVVISKTCSEPMYPEAGYLAALERSTTYWLADNSAVYNGGDFGGYLIPGQSYAFAITYVFDDGAGGSWFVSSNVLTLTYSGPAAPSE